MRVELRITSGSRAGQRELFDKSVISIGRHPLNDLRFDAQGDPDASSRHAEIRILGDKATVRDLESTNGTFVNGQRVEGERALFDGDLMAFGREGPAVEFHVVKETAAGAAAGAVPSDKTPTAGAKAPPVPATAAAGGARPARPVPPRRDTVARIADAVEAQTGALRKMVIALVVLVVIGAGAAYWIVHRASAQAQARVDELLQRNDSLSAVFEKTVGSMKGREAGLDSALAASRTETDQIRARIKGEMEKGGNAKVGDLSERLDKAEQRQRALVSAGNVDYESIAARNGPAIVFIAVQEADDSLISGSGFNVSPSGLIVTNRHVVQDEQGRAAKRVKVIFENTHGAWKSAHVIKVSATDELAFIKIDDAGTYPVVAGVAKETSVRVGSPVALMGYPLGTSTAGMGGDINKLSPKSTLGLGTVSKLLADTLQFDAYAAPGSSGSAVFDARGFVVGVLFGGQQESNGRIVYAVPGAKLAAQLPPEASAIIR
jgi:S1-C subfamily serine protease